MVFQVAEFILVPLNSQPQQFKLSLVYLHALGNQGVWIFALLRPKHLVQLIPHVLEFGGYYIPTEHFGQGRVNRSLLQEVDIPLMQRLQSSICCLILFRETPHQFDPGPIQIHLSPNFCLELFDGLFRPSTRASPAGSGRRGRGWCCPGEWNACLSPLKLSHHSGRVGLSILDLSDSGVDLVKILKQCSALPADALSFSSKLGYPLTPKTKGAVLGDMIGFPLDQDSPHGLFGSLGSIFEAKLFGFQPVHESHLGFVLQSDKSLCLADVLLDLGLLLRALAQQLVQLLLKLVPCAKVLQAGKTQVEFALRLQLFDVGFERTDVGPDSLIDGFVANSKLRLQLYDALHDFFEPAVLFLGLARLAFQFSVLVC